MIVHIQKFDIFLFDRISLTKPLKTGAVPIFQT